MDLGPTKTLKKGPNLTIIQEGSPKPELPVLDSEDTPWYRKATHPWNGHPAPWGLLFLGHPTQFKPLWWRMDPCQHQSIPT